MTSPQRSGTRGRRPSAAENLPDVAEYYEQAGEPADRTFEQATGSCRVTADIRGALLEIEFARGDLFRTAGEQAVARDVLAALSAVAARARRSAAPWPRRGPMPLLTAVTRAGIIGGSTGERELEGTAWSCCTRGRSGTSTRTGTT
ncbi:hypothetical protein [Actinomadura verrucosospora]|uniref:hypothetical protein n=1 Tax=Actinomadura verrucosospora TaxID=46165 RepID=UPI001563AB1E|nr:hypothetical protein [Actinomadura verrucosospora]